ncbi:TPA: diacylglycerol kinase family lipid kinase [Candidatus Woesearchaeota archaeon]|nr:diacylglycerol kinase family lipid kinase [Candidatus Woesearchaeota archaeon]
MRKRYLLIINPNAGQSRIIEEDIVRHFSKRGLKLDVCETRKPKDATRIARKAVGKYDVVMAAGGDGTVNEVINGLAGSETELGIIPAGTENVLSKELKIPQNHLDAAKKVIRNNGKLFDLGKAKNRYFIMMAGVGLDAKASRNVEIRPALKKMMGRLAYPLVGLETYLKDKPSRLKIWLDDQRLPRCGYYAVIGNIKQYGGNIKITPKANPKDGYLDITIFKSKDVFSMLKYFIGAKWKDKIVELPSIEYFRVKKIKIQSKDKVYAHTDAEIIGTTPVNIEVVPKAIRIIC